MVLRPVGSHKESASVNDSFVGSSVSFDTAISIGEPILYYDVMYTFVLKYDLFHTKYGHAEYGL